MAVFVIPLALVVVCIVLIILLGTNERALRHEADEEPVLSEFERHQKRVREARERAERRHVERARERL